MPAMSFNLAFAQKENSTSCIDQSESTCK